MKKVLLNVLLLTTMRFFCMVSDQMSSTKPEVKTVSQGLKKSLNNWLAENPSIKEKLIQQPGKLADFYSKWQEGNKELASKGIKNLSEHNFVFVFPEDPTKILKISGSIGRYCLHTVHHDKPRKAFTQQELDDMGVAAIPTYQTYSEIHNAMVLEDIIKTDNLDCLSSSEVKKYLLVDNNESLSDNRDENVIAVIERNNALQKVNFNDQELLNIILTEKALGQLLKAAVYVGLWNVAPNLHYNKNTKKLMIIDLEQPDTTKLHQMYGQDPKRHAFNASCGMQGLLQLFPKNSPQRDQVVRFVKTDPVILSAYNYEDIAAHFDKDEK